MKRVMVFGGSGSGIPTLAREVAFIDALPMTATGKIMRRALKPK